MVATQGFIPDTAKINGGCLTCCMLQIPLASDGPVDCGGTCLNHGQPAIPRFQFDLARHKLYVGGVNLGKGIIALPQKLGGGVSLTDIETGQPLQQAQLTLVSASTHAHTHGLT